MNSGSAYLTPVAWEAAARLLATPGATAVAGATDLVPLMHERIVTPRTLVDVRGLPGSRELTWQDDGSLSIGASVTLETLSRDAEVRRRLPMLAEAALSVGSPALRHAGTLGGNLCQHVRCWYYRGGHECLRRGGSSCSAEIGENQYHAIFRQGRCVAVHPSDCAVVLVALDAIVHLRGASEARDVPAANFLVTSRSRLDHTTCLTDGEVVERVTIPGASMGGVQWYRKQMQRASWDFAMVSLAASRREDGNVRLVLGGVANTPWRVTNSIEEDVASGGLSQDDIDTLADRALYDAQPLEKNAYKVDIAAALLRRAMATLLV